jgi:hypothetical protein
MKISELLVGGAVAGWVVAAIAASLGFYAVKSLDAPASAELAERGHWWDGGHRSGRRHGRGQGWCTDAGAERSLAALTPYAIADLKLDATQETAWKALADEADRALHDLGPALCGHEAATAPEALARLRAGLASAGAALAAIEPRLAAFYGGLDQAQRARLDGYVRRHGARQ